MAFGTGTHETTIDQMYRLWRDYLFKSNPSTDEERRIRLDDLEMRPDIQEKVMELWHNITNENLKDSADIAGYWNEFYQMFGFEFENVDYSADVDAQVQIPSLVSAEN